MVTFATEGLLRDWRDKASMGKGFDIDREEVQTVLDKFDQIEDRVWQSIYKEKMLKKFPDSGFIFKYYHKSHFLLMNLIVKKLLPVVRKLTKITKNDVEQFKTANKGKLAAIELIAKKDSDEVQANPAWLGAREYEALPRNDTTFQVLKLDKTRIKSLLKLWTSWYDAKGDNGWDLDDPRWQAIEPTDVLNMLDGDHDDGPVNWFLNHTVIDVFDDELGDKWKEMLPNCSNLIFKTLYPAIGAWESLKADVPWAVRRVLVLLKREKAV